MIKTFKTLQIALNWVFMGYGGFIPHVDQRPAVFSSKNSRALTWRLTPTAIARPADGFRGLGLMGLGLAAADFRGYGLHVTPVHCSPRETNSLSLKTSATHIFTGFKGVSPC